MLVSKVMGATIGNPGKSLQLISKVDLFFSVSQFSFELNKSSASCVFWDTQSHGWSTDGCEVIPSRGNYQYEFEQTILRVINYFSDCSIDETVVHCRCNHLTNFAVLMDIHGLFKNQVSLEFIRIVSFLFY